MPKEKEEFQQETCEIVDCDSEQLVTSAVKVLEPVAVPELADVKQKLLMRQEEIQSKKR